MAPSPEDPVDHPVGPEAPKVSNPPMLHGQDEGATDGSQATQLVALAEGVEFFHTPEGEAYATLVVRGHKETWALKSKTFRQWLQRRFYEATRTALSAQALQEALGVLEARANFDGPKIPVFTRLGETGGRIYLDLANDAWEAVEVSPEGWKVLQDPPVRFRRPRGMLSLPVPVRGGSLGALRSFLNVGSDADFILMKGWLAGALNPAGPHLLMMLVGEQGSAKSTTAKALKGLLDPSTAPLRAAPRDERDLMIGAKGSLILGYDNLSGLQHWFSDALCRLSTGGGLGTRELYSNDQEILFDAKRPVLLNGIDDLGTRGDILDRAISLNLPEIPKANRRSEREFWKAYEAARPGILGALLDAVVAAMGNLWRVKVKEPPRMMDPILWVTAAEAALEIPKGGFVAAYTQNKGDTEKLALEASPVVEPLRAIAAKGEWEGVAGDLLLELSRLATPEVLRQRGWPRSPNALTNALRRLAPNFRGEGIKIGFRRSPDKERRRLVSIVKA